MSVQKRKSSGKKRNPKIKLDRNGVLLLTGIIALCCVLLLAFSIILNSPEKKSSGKEKEKIVKVEKNKSDKAKKSAGKKTDEKASAGSKKLQDSKDSKSSVNAEKSSGKAGKKVNEAAGKADGKLKKSDEKNTGTEKNASFENKVSAGKKSEETGKSAGSSDKNADNGKASDVNGKSSGSKQKEAAVLPDKSSEGKKTSVEAEKHAAVKFNIPDAKNAARLVFVFDDAGYSLTKLKRYTELKMPLTVAVMPKLPHSADCAELARKSGKEVILHQPMQSLNLKLNPGEGAVKPDMNTFEIAELVKENIDEIGPVKGVNNHEGSLITEDEIKIGTVLDVALEKGLYFLDSRTTAQTKAPQAALERDVKILERDVFLDDAVNREEILKEIYRALDVANKKGKAIMIGHVDKSADIIPVLLEEMYPLLLEKGYVVCLPSDLL